MLVQENLDEELDAIGSAPEALAPIRGIDRRERSLASNGARPLPGVAALLDSYDEASTQGTLAQAVASFYAYEAQVPEIAARENLGPAQVLRHYRAARASLFRGARGS